MRLHVLGAAHQRALICALALALATTPLLTDVSAQDTGGTVIASSGEDVLLRESPGWDSAVLSTLGDGSPVGVTGEVVTAADGSAWAPVDVAGVVGYVPAGYVAAAPVAEPPLDPAVEPVVAEPEPVAVAPETEVVQDPVSPVIASGTAASASDAQILSAPDATSGVLQVIPAGTLFSIDGDAVNGFLPVTANGVSGWIAADLLAQGAPNAAPPPDATTATLANPEPAPADPGNTSPAVASSGITWPMRGGSWKVVQGYNNGTHTNRSNFAQYAHSLDLALAEGDSAGQPLYAPVSGSIEWTDRGSGGILINAGNGYGVALFHVNLDRGVARDGKVTQGEQIGSVAGPGDAGYESMSHVEITAWQLHGDGSHSSVPFTGPNAIAGQEFPDNGTVNQYMDAIITP